MKTNILIAIKLTTVFIILFMVIYPTIIWVIGQASPNRGKGTVIRSGDKEYFSNVGQSFTDDGYFNSRPSAVSYNAAGSGGSNKGPTNPQYLAEVKARLDTFLIHNPGIKASEVPADLLTASGSGLDPHISEEAALLQISRISNTRGIPEIEIRNLVHTHLESPLLGLFGPKKINVLKINLALDKLDK